MDKERISEVGVTLVQQVPPEMICTIASPAMDSVSQLYCKALQPAPGFCSYPLLLRLLINSCSQIITAPGHHVLY